MPKFTQNKDNTFDLSRRLSFWQNLVFQVLHPFITKPVSVFFAFNVFYWTFYLIVMPEYAQKNEEEGGDGQGWKKVFVFLLGTPIFFAC